MKKNIINGLYVALFASFALVSCENTVDQEYVLTGVEPIATISADKTALLESDNPATVGIDESVLNVSLVMDKAHKTPIKYKVEFISSESTGSLDDVSFSLTESPIDFGSAGFLITVPAYSTTVDFTISAILDLPAEATENFKFKVYPVGNLDGQVNPSTQFINFTLGNSVSNDLRVILDWNGDAEWTSQDEKVHTLDDFDFDLEIYDASFNIVADSYSDSPEQIDFDAAGQPDGTYFIVPSYYSNKLPAAGANINTVTPMLPIYFDVKVTVSKPGVFTRIFDLAGKWNTITGGDQQGNPDAYYLMAYFVKTTTGGVSTYQLYDMDDNLLVSGRFANIKSILSSKSKKTRK